MNAVSATDLEAPRREALRARLVSEVPRWYSPWVHLAAPTLFGLALIVGAAFFIHGLTPLEALFAPLILLVSNATEWRVHRDLLHKRTRFFEVLFDRHTPEHHAIYVGVFMATSPITAALWFAKQTNLAALFVMATMFYVVSYEWLHLSYHLAPES